MADWIHNYPGVAKLLQQEEDVLEGVSQIEEMPSAAPLPPWGMLPLQGEQGCVVTPPLRCGCQRPIVRWEHAGLPGRIRIFHEACTCAWQMIVIREFLRLPPLRVAPGCSAPAASISRSRLCDPGEHAERVHMPHR
jgi:hypothetical protein